MAQKEKVDFEVSCVFCPEKFKSLKLYNKHYNKMHSHEEHPESTLYCIACGYAYKRQGHLMNHMRIQHPTFNYKPTSTVMSPESFVRMQAPNADEPVASTSGENNDNEAAVIIEDEPIEVPDEKDSKNGTALTQESVLSESIQLCIDNQQSKITEMERAITTREEEVAELKRDIKDHKVIIETLKRDLESPRKSKTTSMKSSAAE